MAPNHNGPAIGHSPASPRLSALLSWTAIKDTVSQPGEERAKRLLALLLLFQRAAYLALLPIAIIAAPEDAYFNSHFNLVLLGVAIAWNVYLAYVTLKQGWFPIHLVWVDTAVIVGLLIVASLNMRDDFVFGGMNWPGRLAMGTVALIAAALPLRHILVAWVFVVAARFGGTTLRVGEFSPPFEEFVGVLNAYIWFAIVFYFLRYHLIAQGRALDALAQNQVALEATKAANQARFDERIAQHRRLHDTVLTTLTAIARGGLDYRENAVRARCAAEADYVRRLICGAEDEGPGHLETRLSDTIAQAETLGLRVHHQHDQLPDNISPALVDALCGAVMEALNNVVKHAGTHEAWVTATVDEGVVKVRIVDRGCGFSPPLTEFGFGISQSIYDRMSRYGGYALVDSEPNCGTIVELACPVSTDARALL
ncbi:hypothetical protein IEU95_04580 [Hoyosella rhizosphaerae]|uniref:Histidine kinase/HSP90-like ATPase domain-containing protein n=1 Tax=Hoyosella rhizosphaerae TaxID=1755582 RepID=A0A916XEZ0_9ACTN|nr:ATP-binding protein [Hoyosella rhizosphaerae]MBN4926092.1 hypothetical protein [Hoyosella rhizosphaerae]GGC65652.1 hypothetical protein GCM10011410_17680 [Hoyosella rhizosphaerae]